MELGEAILAVGAGDRAPSFELFSETLDAEWIAQALQATGTATLRRPKLPAEYVVWLVIGEGVRARPAVRRGVPPAGLGAPGGRAPRDGERQRDRQSAGALGARAARRA